MRMQIAHLATSAAIDPLAGLGWDRWSVTHEYRGFGSILHPRGGTLPNTRAAHPPQRMLFISTSLLTATPSPLPELPTPPAHPRSQFPPVRLGDEQDGSDTVNYQERSAALITPRSANEVPGIERCYANDGMQKGRSNLGFILIKSDLLSLCFLVREETSYSERWETGGGERFSKTSVSQSTSEEVWLKCKFFVDQ